MYRRRPMADVSVRMRSIPAGVSKAQSREARRRRKELMRMKRSGVAAAAAAGNSDPVRVAAPERPPPPPSSSSSSNVPAIAGPVPRQVLRPPAAFGAVSIPGRMGVMEDRVSIRPGFARLAAVIPLDFFAVFDGHGGPHVAVLCMERMHWVLAEEVARGGPRPKLPVAVRSAFARVDELALSSCACGRVSNPRCRCERSGLESHIAGSTATVALVGPNHVMVANCGDSRAVLSRGGTVIAMTNDHKPDHPGELARIEAAGGRVIYRNGARVDGVLAVSRAIGDKYFKPAVTSDPEIHVLKRHQQDDFLIVASDGLWDIVTNEMACNVARSCLMEGNPARGGGALENGTGGAGEKIPEFRCMLAANLLARIALAKGSTDNISVVVVDLRIR